MYIYNIYIYINGYMYLYGRCIHVYLHNKYSKYILKVYKYVWRNIYM